MSISKVQAIDVHAHFGPYVTGRAPRLVEELMSGDPGLVVRRARLANTRLTVVSSLQALLPRGGADPIAANTTLADDLESYEELLFWVVVDPLKPDTYHQAADLLQNPQCAGIKIHPEEHRYPIADYGRKIFEFAARHHAIISTHSGELNSLPADFIPFANDFPEATLILAHLGCGHDDDPAHQVRAVQAAKHPNVCIDASSARNIMSGLIEWAVREVGPDRILYGTDSPLYFAPMQRARIDAAEIPDDAKMQILCANAQKLLRLSTT